MFICVQVPLPANPHLWSGIMDSNRTNKIASTSCRNEISSTNRWRFQDRQDQEHGHSGSSQYRAATPYGRETTTTLVWPRAEDATRTNCPESPADRSRRKTANWQTENHMDQADKWTLQASWHRTFRDSDLGG